MENTTNQSPYWISLKWSCFRKAISDYRSEIKSLGRYIVAIPIVLLFSYLFYNVAEGDMVIAMGREDSFFEWFTSLFYFISFILLVLTFKKNRNIFILLLSLVMLFGACEEISWGQRIFGFETPEDLNKINMQHEFNIHNLEIFYGKISSGHKKQGLERLLEMDLMFKIFTGLFGIVLQLGMYHFKPISTLTQKLKVPVPPISMGIFFALSWITMMLSLSAIPLEANMNHYWRIFMAGPEIAEFIGSFILALICLYFYNNRNKDIMGKDFKQLHSWATL